ncbi:MAG: hypothetical protein QG633_644 [Patescibacteria group bacterium]|nr:hypothetical protein [Patescibacteria group bacterium]
MLSVVALVVYLIFFWKTTARVIKGVFRSDVVHKIGKGLKLPFLKGLLTLVLLLICGMVGYGLAPVLWAAYRYHDRKVAHEKRRRAEEQRLQAEKLRAERQAENKKRTRLQEEWFAENPRKLFFNTMGGVTAVLSPNALEAGEKETRYARLDGLWGHEKILKPTGETCLFVTIEGQGVVRKHLGERVSLRMLSGLHALVERHKVELCRDERIFVPAMSEAIMCFDDQAAGMISDMESSFDLLIAPQTPYDLRLLPEY